MTVVPFVGRADERSRIGALLAQPIPGPRAAFVFGDPGFGKSRLLTEVAADGRSGPVRSLAGYQPEAVVPLAAARSLLRDVTVGASVADPLPLFEAADRMLEAEATTLIIVDDLHWFDELSRALLHYLLRSAVRRRDGLALIAASRDEPEGRRFAASVRALLGDAACLDLRLGPLSRAESADLILSLKPKLGSAEAHEIYEKSGGSPLWLELLGRMQTEADLERAVQARTEHLSPDAITVLHALALTTRPIELDKLIALLGWPRNRVLAAIDESQTNGLTTEVGGAARITHDLLRDVIGRRQDAKSGRHEDLRLGLARLLEDDPAADVGGLLEAVEHRRAARAPTLALAMRIACLSQRGLIGRRGLDLLGEVAADPAHSPEARLNLERELATIAGELGDLTESIHRWVSVAGREDDRHRRARAWLEASLAALTIEDLPAARGFLARARSIPSPDESICVHWDAHEASVLFLERELDRGSATARRALRRARALTRARGRDALSPHEHAAYVRALRAAGEAARLSDDPSEMLDIAEETIEAARSFDQQAHLEALRVAGFSLLMLGRASEAEARLRAAWEQARVLILPTAILDAGFWLVLALHTWGRLIDAEKIVHECVELGERIGTPFRSVTNVNVAAHLIELSRGDRRSAIDGLRKRMDAEPDPHARTRSAYWLTTALARVEPTDNADEVRARLADAEADAAKANCLRCQGELDLRGADALARVGAVDQARAWTGRFARRVRRGTDPYLGWWRARAGASIAVAAGGSKAERALVDVIADADRLGFGLEAIWARLDLSEVGTDRAHVLLEEARAQARSLGAVTEQRVAEQALRRIGVRAWHRGPAAEGALTDREWEVARLVSDGSSNPEIASELFVSRKTVESHVTKILTKLGLKNRAELARWASEQSRENRGAPR